jgi:hypothetical protein
MRTTLDLPEKLLEEGLRVTRAKNKTALIVQAIESVIRRNQLMKLIQQQGKIPLNLSTDRTRKRSK